MEISINSLVSIEKAINEAEAVFKTVDEIGKVIVLKDNKPCYILLKYEENGEVPISVPTPKATYTLQEARGLYCSEGKPHFTPLNLLMLFTIETVCTEER